MFENFFKSKGTYKLIDVDGVRKLVASKEIVTDKEAEKLKATLRQEQAILNQLEKLGITDELLNEVKETVTDLETLISLKEDLQSLKSTDPKVFIQNYTLHKKRFDTLIDNLKNLDISDEEKSAAKDAVKEGVVESEDKTEEKKDVAKPEEDITSDEMKEIFEPKASKTVVADKNVDPNNKKYKDSGIKEKLLLVNKIIQNIKTDTPVENAGGVGADVITPGDKSKIIQTPTNKITPDSVVQKVVIKIDQDPGDKGKLLNNPSSVKFPQGDKVVSKASLFEQVSGQFNITASEIDTQKLNTKTEEKKNEILNKIKDAGTDTTKVDYIVKTEGIEATASLFNKVQSIFKTANAETEAAPQDAALINEITELAESYLKKEEK